jgi:YbgC/YbaW family acyl-CoA thioester hydrolase
VTRNPFTIDEYVRWSDVDFAGVIFYGAYVRFFEMAETELFREAGVAYGKVFERFDIWLPRAHLDCDFHYPARLDDRLRVAAYFTKFGRTSISLSFDVLHIASGELAATAHEVLVCADRRALKPQPLPAELISLLDRFRLSAADARTYLGVTVDA